MAAYTRTEQTITNVRFELDTPTNAAEVIKALKSADRDFLAQYGRTPCDDELHVDVEGELVVVWFRKQTEVPF